jgi:hypothetical protein
MWRQWPPSRLCRAYLHSAMAELRAPPRFMQGQGAAKGLMRQAGVWRSQARAEMAKLPASRLRHKLTVRATSTGQRRSW